MITYMNNKYSVPAEYIGKPVSLRVVNDDLHIYFSTEIVATHKLSNKKLNYHPEHYIKLLSEYMNDADAIAELAEANLRQMDALL